MGRQWAFEAPREREITLGCFGGSDVGNWRSGWRSRTPSGPVAPYAGEVDHPRYERLSATEIAGLVNRRAVTASELARVALARARPVDARLRVFTRLWSERAMETAARVDQAVTAGATLPLAGVPLAVKASHRLSSPQLVRLLDAGCVPIGATAIPEPGTAWQTWGHTDRGHTRNPWRVDRSPGGSSAGSAVAVATGVVPLATASDGAGSTRIPAAWCGVFGLKPTTGRLPGPDRSGLTVVGPIARDPSDLGAYLDVVYGPDPSPPGGPRRPLRVAWSTDLGYADVDPRVAAIGYAAVTALAEAGYVTIVDHALRMWDPTPAWQVCRTGIGDGDHVNRIRAHNNARLRTAFDNVDLIATPCTPNPAHGHDGPGSAMSVALTWAFNLSGHPAITMPAGMCEEGTPVGLQLVARKGEEALLLSLGHVNPMRCGWTAVNADGCPAVHAE